MPRSAPVDGFSLSWTDDQPTGGAAEAPAIVLLHGWPGDSHDYRLVRPLLDPGHRVVVPDLRGFGDSDRWLRDPARSYSASAQAASVAGLIRELGLERPVVAGYDVGSSVAQTLASEHPELVGALAVSPPLPGAGRRVLDEDSVASTGASTSTVHPWRCRSSTGVATRSTTTCSTSGPTGPGRDGGRLA